jgi:hypothetical protein
MSLYRVKVPLKVRADAALSPIYAVDLLLTFLLDENKAATAQ